MILDIMKNLNEFESVETWLKGISAKHTKNSYLQSLKSYVNFLGIDPDTLINEAEAEEINVSIRPRNRKIKNYVLDYKIYLQESGLSENTIKGRLTGIRSFYSCADVTFPKLQDDRQKTNTIKENDAIPTKEDLQEVLKICDPLEKAVVLVGVSSGLASNEIRQLKVEDFKKGYDDVTGITTLKVRRQKVGTDFITFLSSEASLAVKEYLDFRNRDAKTATARRKRQLENQRIVNDDGYLFILRQVPDTYLETQNEELRQLSENAVQKMYRSLSDKAQKNTKKGYYNVIRSHTTRKYFSNTLKHAECGTFYVEYWMGHTLDATQAAYFKAVPDKLREIYRKYMPYLIIEKKKSITEDPEFKRLEEEVQNLKGENEKLKLDRYDNEALKRLDDEIKELKKAQKERYALRKEFEPFFEEERVRRAEIEDITNMSFDDVEEKCDTESIVPSSEKLKEHRRKMAKDEVYRARCRAGTSSILDRKEVELGKKYIKIKADNLE